MSPRFDGQSEPRLDWSMEDGYELVSEDGSRSSLTWAEVVALVRRGANQHPPQGEPMTRFEIRRNRLTRRYRVVLIAENGEPLSVSEHLTSREAALVNIEAQRACVPVADVKETA